MSGNVVIVVSPAGPATVVVANTKPSINSRASGPAINTPYVPNPVDGGSF